MNDETQQIDRKSLRLVTGEHPNWKELAKDCVCFANARGGQIQIGIENDSDLPPLSQRIDKQLPEKIRKRIAELTINVGTYAEIKTATNGGEYIELQIFPSLSTIASTTEGRYYIRISDHCTPLLPEDMTRLLTDKSAFIWETKVARKVRRKEIDPQKMNEFITDIHASNRVSGFIKEKSPDELLEHYLMTDGEFLTNLGILWVGKREDRAQLLYAPVIQFLKYDEHGKRINKTVWDDYSLNPKELIESVWTQIPDWKEGIEVSNGIFRQFIPNYEEEVIRELVVNALVHRPYTTRGDIFINLFPDRMEVHNPGLLPVGVTPQNILHKTTRRNDHLAKIFYDLKLMEREGTGYDSIYEILLTHGKHLPIISEGEDRVSVAIKSQILRNDVISLVNRATEQFSLRQKEIICLGLIAQNITLSAIEFSKTLNLHQPNAIRDWLGRLLDFDIIKAKGKTKGTEYFVNPTFLRNSKFISKTSLKKIEPHRLKELIIEDISMYPNSSLSEIHSRIGSEIAIRKIQALLYRMTSENILFCKGQRRWRRYSINKRV
ncbi:MAG: transcriptional regulator [Bacteroidetes bacterium]|nr:MAG: transcriptional regulator [Bacteroidota bacterium]